MSEPDLLYTDVEDALRSSVRDLLASRCRPEAIIAVYDGDRSVAAPLWKSLAGDLGVAGLLVAEDRGGAGASAREAAVVMEELGRSAAPVPFLTSAVVATVALAAAPEDTLLESLATGERTAVLTVPFSTGPGAVPCTIATDGDGRMTGTVTSVAGAVEADVLLVPVAGAGGVELRVVDASAATITAVPSLDMTRQLADVFLDGAASSVVVPAGSADAALRQALSTGAALLASEQYGIARWCLDTTIAYLRERRQFGRVVGGFQAVKHRLADLYVLVESAHAAARYAAATAATGDEDRHVAASLAKAYCSDVSVEAAEECIQLHGGIGMTWEHPAHLYLKRAKADQIALGTPGAHRALLGELVDLSA
jgi:alkylation response protein AidB-like acyl-CoA dehydrogenase